MTSFRTDPMCGMELDETKAVAQFRHKGEILFFCSLECNKRFCEMVGETSKTFKSRDALTKDTEGHESN